MSPKQLELASSIEPLLNIIVELTRASLKPTMSIWLEFYHRRIAAFPAFVALQIRKGSALPKKPCSVTILFLGGS